MRLLTLDATISIVPADAAASPSRPHRSRGLTPVRPRRVAPARSQALGRGLADAVRSIDEGAELLAGARPTGS
jgi:hypothetical protein